MSKDYEIGYGKPPKESQYKKGQSGNPKGRTKGSKSLKTAVNNELSGKILLKQNGKPKKVAKIEAVLMRLMKDALEGKARAQAEILKLAHLYLPEETGPDDQGQPVGAEDQALIDAFIKRMIAKQNQGGDDDSNC